MPRFLSPEWVEAFNQAARHVELAEPGPGVAIAARAGTFAVCQTVLGGPEGDVAVTLQVTGGQVVMTPGPSDTAEVTVTVAWDDAVAMARGTLGVIDALTAGRIRVRGDLGVLLAGQSVLAGLQEHLGPLNERTSW